MAANELAIAIREIFDVEPDRRANGSDAPGTRGLSEAALIILSIPPAAHYTREIIARAQLGARLQRLVAKASTLRKSKHCSIMIDPGDGKQIPLEEANREQIMSALQHVEQRLRP